MGCDPYILAALRTPRGKGSAKGALHAIEPIALVTHLLDALHGEAFPVDDVILGCANPTGEQAGNLARAALLAAKWKTDVPGFMVNRYCTSGLDAIAIAASKVRARDASLVIAGGVESVSRVAPPAMLGDIGPAADRCAAMDGIGREECDAYAHATREKAKGAPRGGSIVPLVGLERDENTAFQPTVDELAAMPPLFGGVHTRGNSPSLADAAALTLVGDGEAARRIGLAPRARIVATASAAADPVVMLTAGQTAVEKVLARANIRAADVAVFEFAEAFAALCVRFMRALDVGHDRLNPTGGTIARGHAYGATGAALVVDALEQLERRNGRYAVIGVSGAAGLGAAMLIERV
ncbi:MAG: beta-ketoacyl synthase N-terminal-like domain-containing protein [Kofleriaceae bacterium]